MIVVYTHDTARWSSASFSLRCREAAIRPTKQGPRSGGAAASAAEAEAEAEAEEEADGEEVDWEVVWEVDWEAGLGPAAVGWEDEEAPDLPSSWQAARARESGSWSEAWRPPVLPSSYNISTGALRVSSPRQQPIIGRWPSQGGGQPTRSGCVHSVEAACLLDGRLRACPVHAV